MTMLEKAVELIRTLEPDQLEHVVSYAEYLKEKGTDADAEWDRRLDKAHTLPKFRAMVADVRQRMAAGETEPLDPDRL